MQIEELEDKKHFLEQLSHSARSLRPGSTRPRPAQPGNHHSRQ